jgi:EF-P beta-lysylation protein EpmB
MPLDQPRRSQGNSARPRVAPPISPARVAVREAADWTHELQEVVRDVDELLGLLGIARSELDVDVDPKFPLRVPRQFVRRMRFGDAADPLLRQVLPLNAERHVVDGFSEDPLDERNAMAGQGLIQKYAGRVLLIAAGDCAVHCRYCFRRNFPYSDHRFSVEALDTIRNDASITEVIASGGDPLMLNDRHFFRLLDAIETIGHVQRLRIHTRLPVVIPSRITAELTQRLQRTRLGVVMVLHINHANEIDEPLTQGVLALKAAGVTVLNQAVLLAGVNDDLASQVELSERLFAAQVIPYYLHLLDPVAGGHHFLVADERARDLYAGMRAHLPGYLVPRLARETPGQPAKDWLLA